jgi:hypothetical protein
VNFIVNKFGPEVRCDATKCHTRELAKAKCCARKSTLQTKANERDGALTSGNVKVGDCVSVDHFESRLQGRTYDSYGKPFSTKFVTGALFVEHASGMIHCEHQVGFSAVKTIRAKQSYERLCMDNGVVTHDYLKYSVAFRARKFVSHIHETQQLLSVCGTNAHHQNDVAERAMILHLSMHWKDGIDASLWPVDITYAAHICNNTPTKGVSPMDIFTGSTIPRHRLMDTHVWGCPVYILIPKVKHGQKLPQWQPRSHQGIFMGLSQQHTNEVPQLLNIAMVSITNHFHVLFNDQFTTINSIVREEEPLCHWEKLCLENSVQAITDDPYHYIHNEWLTKEEHEVKRSDLQRETSIRNSQLHRISSDHHIISHRTMLMFQYTIQEKRGSRD